MAGRRAARSTASSTATATASRPTSRSSSTSRPALVDRQRGAARGDEGRRRPVRAGRDAAPVRAPERGDHEGRGRLSRAAHGEGRRRRQGPRGPRHREGRRPRHREEPGRHHPHQQRLRGPQHRDQGAVVGLRREGDRGAGRRHRHERPAGEEHADHAREPRRAQHRRVWPRSRCCSAAPRSPAPTWSATCARSTTVASSTARTPSKACTRWTSSWRASSSGTIDPDFGRALGGRILPPRRSEMEAEPRGHRRRRALRRRRPTSRSSHRRSSGHASPRASRSTTSPATSTRPRCSATSGSSGPTSRSARTTPTSRSASGRYCGPSSTRRRPKAGSSPR